LACCGIVNVDGGAFPTEDSDISSLCITWRHPSASRVVTNAWNKKFWRRGVGHLTLYLMPDCCRRRISSSQCPTYWVGSTPVRVIAYGHSPGSPVVTQLAHRSARASAIVSEAILIPARPRPLFCSLALFAFWLRSSVVSVLFSLISETFLREHSRLFLFLDPAFWSLGLLIP
jgi:hypothetical protein